MLQKVRFSYHVERRPYKIAITHILCISDCFCSCLEAKIDAYYTTKLKVQANYLCTHFLKECKDIWTLSFSYTVVNISTLNEELYTSERISVPHDQVFLTVTINFKKNY